jgi:hypothetical protein
MTVSTERLSLPSSYGTPDRLLRWETVEPRLAAAPHYWLVTTRPDSRPHTVPVDGIWTGAALIFGGDATTVHLRNLRANPSAVVHLDSTETPIIVEGHADWHTPDGPEAARLADAARAKYGYGSPPDAYLSGVWRLQPRVVLAWTVLYEDATRFVLG